MLYLLRPMADKGFMFVWAGEDEQEGRRFRETVLRVLPRGCSPRWFFQHDSAEYKAVEFWTMSITEVLPWAELLAREMGMPFDIRDDDPPLRVLYPSRFGQRA